MINKKKGQYRFFYHYYRQYNEMSVHFKNKCYRTKLVECLVPCETKWNNRQPQLVLQGFCTEILQNTDKIIIK